ncbi:Aste57867_21777 [Aphanomyces stellatus]|uniref:Aste57867_21777 protein n=1 Tax=Aphanomyces stellatus TaxID=120398 RepID=A0A485LIE7_9STRA|nr:hypothetical protein As57867_021708 [Aphanomyces stellatus]VFT98446.1 Aste57867_21777 [Aphanomyces stellatus]
MKRAHSPPAEVDTKRSKAEMDEVHMSQLSSLSLDDDNDMYQMNQSDEDENAINAPSEGWPDDDANASEPDGEEEAKDEIMALSTSRSGQDTEEWGRLSSLMYNHNRRLSFGPVHISTSGMYSGSELSDGGVFDDAETTLDVPSDTPLSPRSELKFHDRVFYLQLHPTLMRQLPRRQLHAFREAGLLEIPMGPTCRSFTISREMLTTGPMARIFPHYKDHLSQTHATFEWRVTKSGVDLVLTNASRGPIFVDLQTVGPSLHRPPLPHFMYNVAPGASHALLLHNQIRLLVSPLKYLLLGYIVSLQPFPKSPHPPSHNVLGVLFAHPIIDYDRLGLSLNNRSVHAMHTAMSALLVKYKPMSDLRPDHDTGLPVTFYPQPIDLAVEFASWAELSELVHDGCQFLHLACTATADAIILEDGRGGGHRVGVDALRSLFHASAIQVVQLSAYNACEFAHQLLLDAGVPFVIAPVTRVTSTQLLRFSSNLYRAFMAGHSVQGSFELATHSTLLPDSFWLHKLHPHDDAAAVVLYPMTDQPSASHGAMRSTARKNMMSWSVCKEFVCRLDEAHHICHRLLDPDHETRFICIHGPANIGKTQLSLAAIEYVGFRDVYDGAIRVLFLKDMVDRKGLDHTLVYMQRVFVDFHQTSGLCKSYLIVLDGLDTFTLSPLSTCVLDFLVDILIKMPNVSVVATSVTPTALPPPLKQFHVGLDSNPGTAAPTAMYPIHDLSTDSVLDESTRIPDESYGAPSSHMAPASPVAASKPNCSIM